MKKHIPVFFILFLILAESAFCASIAKEDIPPDLTPWIPWVMHGQEEQLCPVFCNNAKAFQCAWPSELRIQADKDGGTFSQQWTLYRDAWIPLPGSTDLWPEDLQISGSPATVIGRDQFPSLFLEAGEYRISGVFQWKEMPEMMRIPGQTGLLSLSIEGQEIPFPVLDKSGNLWLRKRMSTEKREDRLDVRIFRKITDEIPMKILHRIQVDVSGQAREIRLPHVLPDNAVPLSLTADFPVRMGADKEILAQVRPGKWEIRMESRFPKPPAQIGPLAGTYGQEVWVFEARNDLRMVEIEGPDAIDPGRTALPEEWKSLPAYLMDKDSLIRFKEIRRGNAEPAPDRLNLRRTWWLDFDGKGFTVQDEIGGTMRRSSNLLMHPSGILGRVTVNGQDQLITDFEGKAGVEIRQGNIRVIAESRVENPGSAISAGGWEHDFDSLSGTLHLPPGWKLFAQSGADSASGTWLRKWTLLDIFLILMISVATLKLRSPVWGLAALLCMMLIWQEKDAPRFVWLHILAAFALLRLLPQGKIRSIVRVWAGVAVIVLLALSIPFMMQQIRWGMYPQLEYPWKQYDLSPQTSRQAVSDVLMKTEAENVMQSAEEYVQAPRPSMKKTDKSIEYYARKKAVFTQDPNASVQTGPGLPAWTWHSADIQWHGPVNRSQEIRFYFISPAVNLILAIVRVLFLALYIYGLLNILQWWRRSGQKLTTVNAMLFLG